MRFISIISTWAQILRTFPTPIIVLLDFREYVKMVIGKYRGKSFKQSCMIRKHYIGYSKYTYLIYSTPNFSSLNIFFLFNCFCRGIVKAVVIDGFLDRSVIISVSVYDTNSVHFISMCCNTNKWTQKKRQVYKHKTKMVCDTQFLCFNVNDS